MRNGSRISVAQRACAAGLAALLAFGSVGVVVGCSSGGASSDAPSTSESASSQSPTVVIEDYHNADLGNGWDVASSLDLAYAENFTVDYFDGGYKLICVCNGERFLIVPEGAAVPDGIAEDVKIIQQPLDNVYLVASNAMCLFEALDAVDTIAVSGIKPENLAIESVRSRMESGEIAYGGGSGAPDYELIAQEGCPIAIESTMINHNPDIKQKLNDLGVVVFTEHSSYESQALGRVEWVKLYGALFNKEEEAACLFDEQVAYVDAVSQDEATGKTVAFFYINSNGSAVTRKSGDYVAQMIELAGGTYIFKDLGSASATSTVTMEMEQFYATAKDADYIIYNATIDGGVASLDDLVAKNDLLKNFKAVQEGHVWCTDQDMYQQMINTGVIVSDIHAVLANPDATGLSYLYKLA